MWWWQWWVAALVVVGGSWRGVCVVCVVQAVRLCVTLCRRTLDGRLCAAAFVQNRQAYTGCTDAPNPDGESGRPWCYVESQACMWHAHGAVHDGYGHAFRMLAAD